MNQPRPIRRRWLRVSLRGLMVLVLIAGGGVGWLSYTIRTQRAAIRAVNDAGGQVYEDMQFPEPDDPWPTRAWRAVRGWAEPVIGNDLFFTPTGVGFSSPVRGDVLAHLARLDNLDLLSLDVDDSAPIGAGWQHLTRLKHLSTLNLGGPGVDDPALRAVAQIRSLTRLDLHDCHATDAGFAALADLAALEELDLGGCPTLTTTGAPRLLAGLPALQKLAVAQVAPEAVAALLATLPKQHPNLIELDLSELTLPPSDLAVVRQMPRLSYLTVDHVPLGDAGLKRLIPLPALEDLILDNAGVTDAGLADLAQQPTLRSLKLAGPEITDAGLAALVGLPLRQLILVDLPNVTDAGMASVAQLRQLEELHLSLPRLTDASLISLRQMTGLRSIDVGGSAISTTRIAGLQQSLPNLTRISPVPMPLLPNPPVSLPPSNPAATHP